MMTPEREKHIRDHANGFGGPIEDETRCVGDGYCDSSRCPEIMGELMAEIDRLREENDTLDYKLNKHLHDLENQVEQEIESLKNLNRSMSEQSEFFLSSIAKPNKRLIGNELISEKCPTCNRMELAEEALKRLRSGKLMTPKREKYIRDSVSVPMDFVDHAFRSDFQDIIELLAEIDRLRDKLKYAHT